MLEETPTSKLAYSLRRHAAATAAVIAFLLVGCGGWATYSEIGGAVIAPGRIVVESSVKRVQHPDGGLVAAIHVREGMAVDAGALLISLDATRALAESEIVTTQLIEALGLEARLVAERDGAGIVLPSPLQGTSAAVDAIALADRVFSGQSAVLAARRERADGHKAQLREQTVQLERQIAGLVIQRDAKAKEIAFLAEELADLQALLADGLVAKSRVMALKRDKARLEGERGVLNARMAETESAISERRVELLGIDEERRSEVVAELQDVRRQIVELRARRLAVEDRLRRIDIRAPTGGVVHNLSVHTIGGVVRPGDEIMEIVPRDDRLVVEARIRPSDIEQVRPGQPALVRLTAFDQRTAPELDASIAMVGANLIEGGDGNPSYYRARLTLSKAELAQLGPKPLIAGMPVEVFITTGKRTVLSYLARPVTDQMARAFREN